MLRGGDHLSDLELARATLQGRADAIERFVLRMRCVPLSLTAQNARLGRPLNVQDIEDLAQEVVVMIWRKLDTFSGLSTLETWVYRFASLELMNAIRKKRTRQRVGDLDDDPPSTAGPDARLSSLDYEHVYRALDRLDASEADVIRLKHFQELTFEEIGANLSMPTNTAKTKYYRGLVKLHEILRSHEIEETA